MVDYKILPLMRTSTNVMGITVSAQADVQTVFVNKHLNGEVAAATAMAMAQFLSAELQTADTLTHLADMLRDPTRKAHCIAKARRAYHTCLRFFPRATLTESENEHIWGLLDSLRSRLEAFGERLNPPERTTAWLPQPARPHNSSGNTSRCVEDEVQRFLAECEQIRRDTQEMLRQSRAMMQTTREVSNTRNPTIVAEQPSLLPLLNSMSEQMNTEIELGLTFAQIAKTSRDPKTKARNLENARKAYGVVARFLATNDLTDSFGVGIAGKLSVLRQRIAEVGQAFETRAKAAKSA